MLKIKEVITTKQGGSDKLYGSVTTQMFQEQPFYDSPDFKKWIQNTLLRS